MAIKLYLMGSDLNKLDLTPINFKKR